MLAVLYLIFTEGYAATAGAALLREELAGEAIRLARVVHALLPGEPEPAGLLALMLLQHSRRATRLDAAGALVLLPDQDRTRWDRDAIAEALPLVDHALTARRPAGPYALQAAIAALHAGAPAAAATDWRQIAALYRELLRVQPSPVVALNRAVAVAEAEGPEAGLALLDAIGGALAGYHPFHTARAELHRRAGRPAEAAAAYRRALELVGTEPERAFLEARMRAVAPG